MEAGRRSHNPYFSNVKLIFSCSPKVRTGASQPLARPPTRPPTRPLGSKERAGGGEGRRGGVAGREWSISSPLNALSLSLAPSRSPSLRSCFPPASLPRPSQVF